MTYRTSGAPLRIAVITPPWFEIPPSGYGGIEWMCHWLIEGLVDAGHEGLVVGAGRSGTRARFVATYDTPQGRRLGEPLPDIMHAARAVPALAAFDPHVVHDHTLSGPLTARARRVPTVVTAHGPVDGEIGGYYAALGDAIRLVSISQHQRSKVPGLPWAGTVHNAIPVADYPFRSGKEDFGLFLGRMSPEKAPHLAIEAARRAGLRLVIAAKCNEEPERRYFDEYVRPLLGTDTDWIGEADTATKKDLLARARCLVFPIQWDEPFGIVMIEALACGTPVVALRAGSVPEVVDHGETGYVCGTLDEMVDAIGRTADLDPAACRRVALARFDVRRMVDGYELVYRRVLAEHAQARRREAVPALLAPPDLLTAGGDGSPALTYLP
ncbi:MAG: glycosyltransferase family 4 protein [Actinomycetota bacterium]